MTAVSSLTVVYPKVVLTVVFIPTVVYILTVVCSLPDNSPQHSPHSYFHVILISAYPAVNFMHMSVRNNKLTYYLLERKAVCKPATTRREETNAQMTALVRVPRTKTSRAKPFNDWALPAYSTAVTAEVPLDFSPK